LTRAKGSSQKEKESKTRNVEVTLSTKQFHMKTCFRVWSNLVFIYVQCLRVIPHISNCVWNSRLHRHV